MDPNLLNDFIVDFNSLCRNISGNYDKDNRNVDKNKTNKKDNRNVDKNKTNNLLNIIQDVIAKNFNKEEFSNFIACKRGKTIKTSITKMIALHKFDDIHCLLKHPDELQGCRIVFGTSLFFTPF